MELNREQIIKQMQEWCDNMCENACLKGESLNGRVHTCKICFPNTVKNALSLIKELTEENEEKDETIAGLIGTIKDAYGFAVKEMKARLDKNLIAIKDHTGKIGLVVLDRDIDQIAKEMLEE